jgi:hypothetical protein
VTTEIKVVFRKQALAPSGDPIFTKAEVSKIISLLTPLRLLLLAEKDPSALDLESNLADRANTMIFCINQVKRNWQNQKKSKMAALKRGHLNRFGHF